MKNISVFLLPFLLLACSSDKDGVIEYTGTIDANTVRVSSETQGRILALHFDEGQILDSAAVLIEVESDKLGFQLSAQEAGINEVRNNYEAASRELQAASLERDNLKQKVERFTALLKSNAVTVQQVDDLATKLKASNRKLEGAQKKLAAILNRKQQMESTMSVTKDMMAKTAVLSPIAGTVLVRYVENGELAMPGSPICEIANLNDVWTKIYISETELPDITIGQSVSVYMDGKEDSPLEGIVSWISSESEFTPKTILTEETRTSLVYAAKVRIDNGEGMLKIGMPVSVEVKGNN
jgi:membrane fusion protein YbhG